MEKKFSEFKELHDALSAKPFAQTLNSLPRDLRYTSFSTAAIERRRRQLERYISFLCTHPRVLLDEAIWLWLQPDETTEIMVRLVVAHSVQWAAEVGRCIARLEEIAAGGEISRCVHQDVLEVLRKVLLDSGDEALQATTCRLIGHLLAGSLRARQIFLVQHPHNDGAEALLQLCRSGGNIANAAAREATKRVLQALCLETEEQVQAGDGSQTARGNRERERARSSGDDEPVECCVCLDKDKSHALLPCGHLCVCVDCADQLAAGNSPCPVCRRPIDRAVQIFV
jgi:hypothetical protein